MLPLALCSVAWYCLRVVLLELDANALDIVSPRLQTLTLCAAPATQAYLTQMLPTCPAQNGGLAARCLQPLVVLPQQDAVLQSCYACNCTKG